MNETIPDLGNTYTDLVILKEYLAVVKIIKVDLHSKSKKEMIGMRIAISLMFYFAQK
jgi:hypothetical protein